MHKPCITVGMYACDPGSDLFNLLVSKKVDLVLSGHEHTYQRSHQLAQGAGCATLAREGTTPTVSRTPTVPSPKAPAVVAMVVGTGGNSLYDVNSR